MIVNIKHVWLLVTFMNEGRKERFMDVESVIRKLWIRSSFSELYLFTQVRVFKDGASNEAKMLRFSF